jgi:hypothetical protein
MLLSRRSIPKSEVCQFSFTPLTASFISANIFSRVIYHIWEHGRGRSPESIANSLAYRGTCNAVDLQNFVRVVTSNGEANNGDYSINGAHNVTAAPAASAMEQQLSLLSLGNARESSAALNGGDRASGTDALANAPLFPGVVLRQLPGRMAETTAPPAQYALLGLLDPDMVVAGNISGGRTAGDEVTKDNRLFMNTNVPFSTFICGVQGSGKSHTLSCMIGTNAFPPSSILSTWEEARIQGGNPPSPFSCYLPQRRCKYSWLTNPPSPS